MSHDQRTDRTRSVSLILLGAILGAMMVAPAFANHTPKHTARQIKKLNKRVTALERRDFAFFTGLGNRRIVRAAGLTYRASCTEPNPGEYRAELQLLTSRDGAAMDDNNGDEYVPFNIADSPAELEWTEDTVPNIESTGGGAGSTAVASNGTVLRLENYAVGVHLPGRPDTCFFSGTWTRTKAG